MRQRWLSGRAFRLHAALLIWFPGCLIAGWWQVNRAFDGNGLSYLYSVEWPVFALVGAWGWWALIHTDPDTVGRRAQERMATAAQGAGGANSKDLVGAGEVSSDGRQPARRREEEDEALAAYNDRLAELAARGPQSWRHR